MDITKILSRAIEENVRIPEMYLDYFNRAIRTSLGSPMPISGFDEDSVAKYFDYLEQFGYRWDTTLTDGTLQQFSIGIHYLNYCCEGKRDFTNYVCSSVRDILLMYAQNIHNVKAVDEDGQMLASFDSLAEYATKYLKMHLEDNPIAKRMLDYMDDAETLLMIEIEGTINE